MFELHTPYEPAGDQPQAISGLLKGLQKDLKHQTVLGVTGSGKTFTMAQVIAQSQRPAIIMAPNKTLAAQLYSEFKEFFPNNAVEYFVSYYDYYQPEAYIPSSDTFIDKDAQINEQIEQMRLSATKSLLERRDTIVVTSVSAIYGLGDPSEFKKMSLDIIKGAKMPQKDFILKLAELQYTRNDFVLERGTFRVRGEHIDIWPGDQDNFAVRVSFFDEDVEGVDVLDPLLGKVLHKMQSYRLYPKTHYATSRERVLHAIETIKEESKVVLEQHLIAGHLLEAQRLKERVMYDLEMLQELGYCNGVENYSRHLSGASPGSPPPTLFDYLPEDGLVIVDESHVSIPQIGGMFMADRSRKETLVEYGFRLPSALDNRPLSFAEWENKGRQKIYVSATPGLYEEEHSEKTVELVVRPTGLIDPEVLVRPQETQVDDLLDEINKTVERKERVLVTTLTKKMAESLTSFLSENNIKVRYLHSDVDTLERLEILRDLRLGVFDVLVGINLLREGLDLPEVSLVAVLDADKEGFLRSAQSLIQTIGRAARNVNGRAILYADKITASMQQAIEETDRRRQKQVEFNTEHKIVPQSVQRTIKDIDLQHKKGGKDSKKTSKKNENSASNEVIFLSQKEYDKAVLNMEKAMKEAAKDLKFEESIAIRDEIKRIKEERLRFEGGMGNGKSE